MFYICYLLGLKDCIQINKQLNFSAGNSKLQDGNNIISRRLYFISYWCDGLKKVRIKVLHMMYDVWYYHYYYSELVRLFLHVESFDGKNIVLWGILISVTQSKVSKVSQQYFSIIKTCLYKIWREGEEHTGR